MTTVSQEQVVCPIDTDLLDLGQTTTTPAARLREAFDLVNILALFLGNNFAQVAFGDVIARTNLRFVRQCVCALDVFLA